MVMGVYFYDGCSNNDADWSVSLKVFYIIVMYTIWKVVYFTT